MTFKPLVRLGLTSMARRAQRNVSALKSDRSGATAVEFAMILPVFLYLFLGILEIALMLTTQVVIEGAAVQAGRQIRTGQAQNSGDASGAFYSELCNTLYGIVTCSDILYDVRTFSTFSAVDMTVEYDSDGEVVTEGFDAGSAESIVAVRTMFHYNFYTPLIGQFFEDSGSSNRRLLMATTVFRNEPYE